MDHQLRLALVWNGTVLLERNFSQTSTHSITIGEDLDNDLVIPAPDLDAKVELLRRTDTGYAFRPNPLFDGQLNLDDDEIDLKDFETRATEIEMVPGEWGTILLGDNVTIFFQVFDGQMEVAGRGVGERFEGPVVRSVSVSGAMHALFLVLAHLAFDVDPNLESMENLDRFIGIAVHDVKSEPEPEDSTFEEATGKRAEGEEGKTGVEESEINDANQEKAEGKLVDEFNPRNVGVAHAIDSLGAGPLKQLFQHDQGFDNAMAVAFDGNGTQTELPRGVGGMSLRGDERGGGGDTFGRINAIGEVDTRGGRNSGAKLKKKEESVLAEVEFFEPKVGGEFCEKKNIRRVIEAKSNALKYCFEKELQSKPELAGKIIAQWTIDTKGKVIKTSVASSTVGDRSVEGCVTRVIKKLRFAEPKGGGMCVIQYPFVFSGL